MILLCCPASDDSQVAVASETITVEHPIAETFDFLVDGSKNALWRPAVAKVIFASGPAESAVWAQSTRSSSGRLQKADYRVTFYERPGRLELTVVDGPRRPTTMFTLESLSQASTLVTYEVDLQPLLWPFAKSRLGLRGAQAEAANIRNLPAAMDARSAG